VISGQWLVVAISKGGERFSSPWALMIADFRLPIKIRQPASYCKRVVQSLALFETLRAPEPRDPNPRKEAAP
jgi:hypothetical protein